MTDVSALQDDDDTFKPASKAADKDNRPAVNPKRQKAMKAQQLQV